MLKASGFDVIFAAAGNLYLLSMLAGIALVLWRARGWRKKALYSVLVFAIFMAPIGPDIYRAYEHRYRYQQAKALFEERCKTAGEKIYRTVEGVDGILLRNVRAAGDPTDRLMKGAAAAHEFTGDDYIRYFLLFKKSDAMRIGEETSSLPGYRYVDVIDPADGARYRHRLDENGNLKRSRTTDPQPRYAVYFEDIVDALDRTYWVAGSKITVSDLQTGEILGEKVRYVIEPGQGSRAGQRNPWLFGLGCGINSSYGNYSPQLFARKVAKPHMEGTR